MTIPKTILIIGFALGLGIRAQAQTPAPNFDTHTTQFIPTDKTWKFDSQGDVLFDKKLWSFERQGDGSEIFIEKTGNKEPMMKRLVMLLENGVRAFSHFKLFTPKDKQRKEKEEVSSFVFQSKGLIESVTQCEDRGAKPERTCTTVTRPMCQYVNAMVARTIEQDKLESDPAKLGPILIVPTKSILIDAERLEIKALATIITLRGADHQLDNLVRTGSLMGVKKVTQTTRGRIGGKDPDIFTLNQIRQMCDSDVFNTVTPNVALKAEGTSKSF